MCCIRVGFRDILQVTQTSKVHLNFINLTYTRTSTCREVYVPSSSTLLPAEPDAAEPDIKNNDFSNPVDVSLLTCCVTQVSRFMFLSWNHQILHHHTQTIISIHWHSAPLPPSSSCHLPLEITVNNFCPQCRMTLFFRKSRSASFLCVTFIPGLNCSLFLDKYLPFTSSTKPVF